MNISINEHAEIHKIQIISRIRIIRDQLSMLAVSF